MERYKISGWNNDLSLTDEEYKKIFDNSQIYHSNSNGDFLIPKEKVFINKGFHGKSMLIVTDKATILIDGLDELNIVNSEYVEDVKKSMKFKNESFLKARQTQKELYWLYVLGKISYVNDLDTLYNKFKTDEPQFNFWLKEQISEKIDSFTHKNQKIEERIKDDIDHFKQYYADNKIYRVGDRIIYCEMVGYVVKIKEKTLKLKCLTTDGLKILDCEVPFNSNHFHSIDNNGAFC